MATVIERLLRFKGWKKVRQVSRYDFDIEVVQQKIVGVVNGFGHTVEKPQNPFGKIAIPLVGLFQYLVVRLSIRHYLG